MNKKSKKIEFKENQKTTRNTNSKDKKNNENL